MEDYFDILIYLAVGTVLFFINNANSHSTDNESAIDKPSKYRPSTTDNTDWSNTRADKTQRKPVVTKPLLQTGTKKISMRPGGHSSPTKKDAQQPTEKKLSRVLRRYSGWKKAIIMGELIRPYR